MIVPDVNLLVYAYNKDAPDHLPAKQWWEETVNGEERVGIPWVVSIGFIRIMTHPKVLTHPVAPEVAVRWVESWLAYDHVSSLNPGHGHLTLLDSAMKDAGVGANLVTDAHIAALGIEFQAQVCSNDADFGRFSGLKWTNPI